MQYPSSKFTHKLSFQPHGTQNNMNKTPKKFLCDKIAENSKNYNNLGGKQNTNIKQISLFNSCVKNVNKLRIKDDIQSLNPIILDIDTYYTLNESKNKNSAKKQNIEKPKENTIKSNKILTSNLYINTEMIAKDVIQPLNPPISNTYHTPNKSKNIVDADKKQNIFFSRMGIIKTLFGYYYEVVNNNKKIEGFLFDVNNDQCYYGNFKNGFFYGNGIFFTNKHIFVGNFKYRFIKGFKFKIFEKIFYNEVFDGNNKITEIDYRNFNKKGCTKIQLRIYSLVEEIICVLENLFKNIKSHLKTFFNVNIQPSLRIAVFYMVIYLKLHEKLICIHYFIERNLPEKIKLTDTFTKKYKINGNIKKNNILKYFLIKAKNNLQDIIVDNNVQINFIVSYL